MKESPKQCAACLAHRKSMNAVWSGLVTLYRKYLTEARRNNQPDKVRRYSRLIKEFEAKLAAPLQPCTWRKKAWPPKVEVHFNADESGGPGYYKEQADAQR